MTAFDVRPVSSERAHIGMLRDLLTETVASGGSVSFMHPLDPAEAENFWVSALKSAESGERIILGAFDGDKLAGTVSLFFVQAANQPHRAEIGKLMTAVSYRGQGVATLLMQAAETLARQHGRSHLMLDTASEGGAVALYERLGFIRVREVPDFALKPHGGVTGTVYFWKALKPAE